MTEQTPATRIAMISDGTEIDSRVEAARTLNVVNGPTLRIVEVDADGRRVSEVEVYASRKAFGKVCDPQVNWSAHGSVDGPAARQYGQMITLAAELIELAK